MSRQVLLDVGLKFDDAINKFEKAMESAASHVGKQLSSTLSKEMGSFASRLEKQLSIAFSKATVQAKNPFKEYLDAAKQASEKMQRAFENVDIEKTLNAKVKRAASILEGFYVSLNKLNQATALRGTKAISDEEIALRKNITNNIAAIEAFITTNKKRITETEKVANAEKLVAAAIKQTDTAVKKTTKKAPMSSADILALPTKDITSIRLYSKAVSEAASAIYKMSKAGDTNQKELTQLTTALNQASTKLRQFKQDNDRSGASMEKNIGIIANWYNHFGRVALGFTVAYRAMNAFETGLRNTTAMIKEGILLHGELASLQAELATYYIMATGNIEDFDSAMGLAGDNVRALAQASLSSVSTLQELSVALSELAQNRVSVLPQDMQKFSAINDLIVQVAKATGDNVKQIRSEWAGLLTGQAKATNSFMLLLRQMDVIDDEMIKSLRGAGDKSKIIQQIFEKTGEAALKLQETLMRTNPALGMEKWKSTFKVAIAEASAMLAKSMGTEDIFGDILAKHVRDFTKDLFDKEQLTNMSNGLLIIAKAFDETLYGLEAFLKGLFNLTTLIVSNKETLWDLATIFTSYIAFKEAVIIFSWATPILKLFGGSLGVVGAEATTAGAGLTILNSALMRTATWAIAAFATVGAFRGIFAETESLREAAAEL